MFPMLIASSNIVLNLGFLHKLCVVTCRLIILKKLVISSLDLVSLALIFASLVVFYGMETPHSRCDMSLVSLSQFWEG